MIHNGAPGVGALFVLLPAFEGDDGR
jgi:hypothetical protein